MRIQFNSTTHCGHLAKSLKRELATKDIDLALSASQNVVARMMGYRNWQELKALSVIGAAESPSDQDILPVEAQGRREHQARVLATETSIPAKLAASIVDKLRPTGRRLQAVETIPAWRDRLAKLAANVDAQRFEHHQLASLIDYIEGKTKDHPNGTRPWSTYQVKDLGQVRMKLQKLEVDYEEFDIYSLEMAHVAEGVPSTVLDGYVVVPSEDTIDACEYEEDEEDIGDALFMCADCIEDDITEAAIAIEKAGVVSKIFGRGSLLVVMDIRRNLATSRGGDGARLVAAAIRQVNKRSIGPSIKSLAMELLPYGYDDMTYNERRNSADFQTATNHLKEAFLKSAILAGALGKDHLIVDYDTGPADDLPELTRERVNAMWSKDRQRSL